MRRRIIVGQIAVLWLVVLMIVWYRDVLSEKFEPIRDELFPVPVSPIAVGEGKIPHVETPSSGGGANPSTDAEASEAGEGEESPAIVAEEVESSTNVLTEERLDEFVRAVLDPADRTFQRLECPEPAGLARYETLKPPADEPTELVRFFFALDLTQCVDLLPRLLGSIVQAIRFLGPDHCALSIVEGNSDDGTPEVLEAITTEIEALGTEYFFQNSNVDPKASADAEGQSGDRIVSLAKLRNLALQPMLDDLRRYDADTTIIFLNDVAACMEDILELAYQKALLGADMTCAMDWTYVGPSPTFYDVWISRTITGESFFKIPEDGSWDYAWRLFWNDSDTRNRHQAHLPFQVFSCWNGAVAFTAEPILSREVAFRSNNPGECFQGEPQLFCKDLWYIGYNKIAVVPSINLEYSDDRGRDIKALKGYTSKWVGPVQDERSKIDWKPSPPDQVKCMEVLEKAEWRPWNESLAS